MAIYTNSEQTYDMGVTGSGVVREDLSDVVEMISPTDVPFQTAIGRDKATNVLHEWITDELAAVNSSNAQLEGDDSMDGTSLSVGTRHGNYCQISWKHVVVSGTANAVTRVGRNRELAYQIGKVAKELRRDIETIITGGSRGLCTTGTGPQAAAAGSATTARYLAACEAWINANRDKASDADDIDTYTTMPLQSGDDTDEVDGTARAVTESMLQGVIANVWTSGGDPDLILCGSKNKQNISAFTGMSTRMDKGEDKRLVAAIDVYVSDFGEHRIVADRFSPDRTVLVLTTDLWKLAFLRNYQQTPLGKTGDAEKRLLLAEYTLKACAPNGNGRIADLTTS